MKLTKYEYKHNPNGNRKIDRLSNYFPPKIRIIIICVMYITMLSILLDIFTFNKFDLLVEMINLLIIVIVSIFVLEHNPLFIVAIGIRLSYYLFTRNNVHKQIVYNLLKDYRNIIAFEKKISISNVKISFFNPLKILYSKNGKRGCISPRWIKLNEKVVTNEYSNYKKQMDYIHYLKLIIAELYKNI